ncbi:sigma-70 family RNA polymerase sigma factor [Phaeobacter sp.]|uniref:sigma-70 family RNA polymerase sigma factor n=1 Tax=Phaeobacter sp. TaxID=1902409 RepID=UPI0025CDBD19|nr:sigma-70 family RNA polymerase sigma factor [Phaeobacter sp.]
MLTSLSDQLLAADAPLATVDGDTANQREGESVGQESLTDQTVWMLAVRDHRDRQAFGRLFDYFAPRLKGVICRSGLPPSQAEDIVQDVMLTVWRKAAMFDPERAQVSAWIYQIARNKQIDTLRKEKRPVPEELKLPEETQEDAAQVLALDQETQKLRVALGRLKPAQREMVEKAYLGELTHADIREQTGLPLGTIKSRIRLGLERLRHELKEQGLT